MNDPCNDAYDIYLSQLCIQIEMICGCLPTKWKIFISNLSSDHGIERYCYTTGAGMKVHNYE